MEIHRFNENCRQVMVEVSHTRFENSAYIRRTGLPLEPQTMSLFFNWFDPLFNELLRRSATIETPVGKWRGIIGTGLNAQCIDVGHHLEAYLDGSAQGIPAMWAYHISG